MCFLVLATPKSITYQAITLELEELQSSQRMQIVALPILFKKGTQEVFAQMQSFWDKWEKQHGNQKHFGFSHVFSSHVDFPTYLKNYALEQKSLENLFEEYW